MKIENEYNDLCKKYVEADWTYSNSADTAICTGKIQNKIVVNILYPARQFLLNGEIIEIIKNRHNFTDRTKWLIDNSSVLMSLDDNKEELGKIIQFAAKDIKQYYISKKKDEINAAKENYRPIYSFIYE